MFVSKYPRQRRVPRSRPPRFSYRHTTLENTRCRGTRIVRPKDCRATCISLNRIDAVFANLTMQSTEVSIIMLSQPPGRAREKPAGDERKEKARPAVQSHCGASRIDMSVVANHFVTRQAAGGAVVARQRKAEPVTDRIRRDGKFFRIGSEEFYVKGVTYGPFSLNRDGKPLPDRAQVRRDLELILELGPTRLRVYHIPPRGCSICARRWDCGFLWMCRGRKTWSSSTTTKWPSRHGGRARRGSRCGNHPAVLAISVVNEIPPDLVRLCKREAIEDFIDHLVCVGKEEAPELPVHVREFSDD